MATTSLVSLSDYLHSSYEPDADFVDGHIEQRPVGELDHSDLQRQLLLLLRRSPCPMHFTCFPELRIQVSPQRFRVPGLCLIARGTPREQIVRTPPLLCIEVLSPEDTMKRTLLRVADFLAMGVPEVWVVDPVSRTIQVCVGSTMTEHPTGDLAVPNTSIALSIDRVFSVLDES